MADFFKGLSGGFQTGLQFGQAMQQRREQERLQGIMQATPQEVNQPDYQRAQAETQGLAAQDAAEFGLTPQEQIQYAPQAPAKQYGIGGQTFNRMPTQQEIQQARYGAMADVIAERDPARALQMRQDVTRMQREAEEAPLRRQALEQQVGLGKEQLAAAQDVTATRGRQTAFNDWFAKNPNADFNSVVQKTRELGMSPDEQFKAASNITGIEDAEFKASQSAIRKLTRNKSLDELLAAHKDSELLDPNSHFEAIRGKSGQITLNRVDTTTGKVIQPNVFSGNEAEAHKYLNMAAVSPEAVIDYTMNLRKTKAQIAEAEAGTGLKLAQTGYTGALAKAVGDQAKTPAAKLDSIQKALGRPLTEEEKLQGLGLTPKPTAAKGLTDEAKNLVEAGHYKDVPTAIEALKRGSVRDKDNEAWLKIEEGLIKNEAAPEVIANQKAAFMLRRGYAPPMAQQIIQGGIDPSTRKPLTIQDVEAYNKTYPQTPVSPDQLPWLANEARRQGLINQIPR